ncbi:MAG: hypothetical protein ACI9VN_002997 [Patescibacteria group bacterium]|jgi:hypothetical protein
MMSLDPSQKTTRFLQKHLFYLLFLILLFTYAPSLAQNDKIGKEEPGAPLDSKCSRACDYLFQRVNDLSFEWQRYQTNGLALKFIAKNRLVVNSSDVILFGSELDSQTLLFTRLQFDRKGQLKEIKYFFYGPFSPLRSEYLRIREKMKKRIGKPLRTDPVGAKIESTWIIGNTSAVFTFEKESVSSNGVISLLVRKVLSGQNNVQVLDSRTISRTKAKPSTPIETSYSQTEGIKEVKKENNSTTPELVVGTERSVKEKTSVRSEGRDSAPVLFRIDVDDTFIILKSEYNFYWTKVRCKDREGWVKTSLIK